MFVRHNLNMQHRVSRVGYEEKVLEWSEGVEDNEEWHDAWQPALEEPPQAQQALQLSLHTVGSIVVSARTGARCARRVQVMENSAERRIAPLLADGSTPDVAVSTSRSGRAVRRPGALAQYLL